MRNCPLKLGMMSFANSPPLSIEVLYTVLAYKNAVEVDNDEGKAQTPENCLITSCFGAVLDTQFLGGLTRGASQKQKRVILNITSAYYYFAEYIGIFWHCIGVSEN